MVTPGFKTAASCHPEGTSATEGSPPAPYRFFAALKMTLVIAATCIAPCGCSRDPVGDVVAKLRDPNVEVRRAATHSLVEQPINDERVIEELTKNVSDKSAELRFESIEALSKLGPAAKSSLPLVKLRLQDGDKNVRLRAAFTIQKIDSADRSFVPVLAGAMQEGDGRTLLEVSALGPKAAWAAPTLIRLLSHESPKVRTLAARALGSIGPAASAARPELEAARGDSNAVVKTAANDALNRIGSGPAARQPAK
jgi:HEAT repeat protein